MSGPGIEGDPALATLAQEVRALREAVQELASERAADAARLREAEQLAAERAGEIAALKRQVDEMARAAERAARERGGLEERLTFQLRQLKRIGPR